MSVAQDYIWRSGLWRIGTTSLRMVAVNYNNNSLSYRSRRRTNTITTTTHYPIVHDDALTHRGESCGFALKGERLEDLKRRAGAGVKKKMKAVREAFRTHYMAQEEAKKHLPCASARGETPLLCRTKSAVERIVVKLYDDVAPLATKNFIMLAKGVQGERGRVKIGKGGKPLSTYSSQ